MAPHFFFCSARAEQRRVDVAITLTAGIPPLRPGSRGIKSLRAGPDQIVDVKELTCKIFRTKHLAHVVLNLRGTHPRELLLTY